MALLVFFTAAAGLAAADRPPWIHIQVVEEGKEDEKVDINLPLGIADAALNLIKDENVSRGRLRVDSDDMSVAEMRRLWEGLRDAGDGEFVNIKKKEAEIRVRRRGDMVTVDVADNSDKDAVVKLTLPVSVVDALFDSDGETLNLRAAVMELKNSPRGDLIKVDSRESRVRIWID